MIRIKSYRSENRTITSDTCRTCYRFWMISKSDGYSSVDSVRSCRSSVAMVATLASRAWKEGQEGTVQEALIERLGDGSRIERFVCFRVGSGAAAD